MAPYGGRAIGAMRPNGSRRAESAAFESAAAPSLHTTKRRSAGSDPAG
jgi:hypothetical protein